ncbi:hypothetical protein [Pseudenhygromyxa sp. WMMC2535]|uniref:hypothetical protein n=1 Tax=Pseudenhygromyxa sp. WMMC2535 TaxID=2712867 RepID=UPI0020D18BE6|nr:hypothetical protein [Pseudenhygromyxa sp. WMMC2535]
MISRALLLSFALAGPGSSAAPSQAASLGIDGAQLRQHMERLASDDYALPFNVTGPLERGEDLLVFETPRASAPSSARPTHSMVNVDMVGRLDYHMASDELETINFRAWKPSRTPSRAWSWPSPRAPSSGRPSLGPAARSLPSRRPPTRQHAQRRPALAGLGRQAGVPASPWPGELLSSPAPAMVELRPQNPTLTGALPRDRPSAARPTGSTWR